MRTVDHIRNAFDTSPFEDPSCAFSFTEAVAEMLEATHRLDNPQAVNDLFRQMWQAYANLYTTERNYALVAVMGDKYPQLIEHEDTEGVARAIFGRMGDLKPGQSFADVDITDILKEAGIT